MLIPKLTDDDRAYIKKGIELYNSGAFWESHEAWEVVWRRYEDDWRLFLQGLIQMAAGYHQLRRRINPGVVKHQENACEKLARFPDGFLGLNVLELNDGIEETLAEVKAKGSAGIDTVPLDIYPKIRLISHGGTNGKPTDR